MADCRVIIFDSIHKVLSADKIFRKSNLSVTIIPPPREISSNCGIALQVEADLDTIAEILQKYTLNPDGVFRRKGSDYVSEIKKIKLNRR